MTLLSGAPAERLKLAFEVLFVAATGRARARDSLVRIADVGWGSLVFVAVIGGFIGMNIAIQGNVTLGRVGALDLLGNFVARAALREIAPVAVIAFAAAKVGSEIAASIATMQDRGELDALRVSGLDPIALVAAPWLIGLAVALPLLVIVGDVAAALAALAIARTQLGVDGGSFLQGLLDNSSGFDLGVGMTKGFIIGVQVAMISSVAGLRARPGIAGIARATNRAAVVCFVSATVWNFILSEIAYGS